MSKHHKNCKWENYTSVEFLPCPFCRIEVLEEEGEKDRAHGRDFIRLWNEGKKRISELESAIVKTLNENGHLADGENCTLIDLKRAMPTWELE